jgi:hypothetical protein
LLMASSASRSWPGFHVMSSGSAPKSQRERATTGSPWVVGDVLSVAYLRRRRAARSPCSSSGSPLVFPFPLWELGSEG